MDDGFAITMNKHYSQSELFRMWLFGSDKEQQKTVDLVVLHDNVRNVSRGCKESIHSRYWSAMWPA